MTNLLRPKFGNFNPDALAKAEAALNSLSSQFDGWLKNEVAKLKAAHAAVAQNGPPIVPSRPFVDLCLHSRPIIKTKPTS